MSAIASIQAAMDRAHELARAADEDDVRLVQSGRCDGLMEALAIIEALPCTGTRVRQQFQPGERVAWVSQPDGPYGAEHLRPGLVVSVDDEAYRRERLKVRFDDGEERYINPDGMRHV